MQPAAKRTVLKEQILTPYPGRNGLVYRHCAEYGKDDKCTKVELTEYRLDDAEIRKSLIAAQIACWVGPKLYAPCEDDNALCHRKVGKRKFLGILGKRKVTFEKLSFESDYAVMLSARTVCGSVEILDELRGLSL